MFSLFVKMLQFLKDYALYVHLTYKDDDLFSAECTIGMVRGLTPLKHYVAMALWQ